MIVIQRLKLSSYRMPSRHDTIKLHKRLLETLFEASTLVGVAFLKLHPDVPLLYASGVRYRREGSPERWKDIPTVLETGCDDCEGLSIWLAAELRTRAPNSVGPNRRPAACVALRSTRRDGLFHAVVIDRATREVFDPSRKLGMGSKTNKRRQQHHGAW